MKKLLSVLLAVSFLLCQWAEGAAEEGSPEVEAPAAVLMENATGTILYEKGAEEERSPASVTKIMTLLLIFEALESGQLHLEDEVMTSAHAKSMGGSQVFLEEGEVQTAETLIKCIVVASGNDAAVAMAEHLAGTEGEFVTRMNQKAELLGMEHTHFVDCCGLTEDPAHYTCAKDIAVMTRELITRFPKIHEYATIWMENITHVTRQGSSEFGLTNTNKLLRSFEGCSGLKTGSTSRAGYCLSATAERNGIELIAVVLAAPDSKTRFANAASLLNYGFGKCRLYTDENEEPAGMVPVKGGLKEEVPCRYEKPFQYLDTNGQEVSGIEKEVVLYEKLQAPVSENDPAGEAVYRLNGKEIGRVQILTAEPCEKAGFFHYLKKAWNRYRNLCYDKKNGSTETETVWEETENG